MKSVMHGLALLLLAASTAVGAHESCEFDITGTWETALPADEGGATARYRFAPNGTVTTLSRRGSPENPEWVEPPGSEFFLYRLDDPKAPSRIEFIASDGVTLRGSMEISQYGEDHFTTLDANSEPTRWVRVDPQRYFLIFAGRSGTIRSGGPAFAMLIRAEQGRSHVDAFGFYLADDQPIVGPIPDELRRKFMTESRSESDTMLRVELTASEYERSLKVLRTWERRARERTLLYEVPYLNSIVFLEEMARSVNACGERIRLYDLDWTVNDKITARHNLPQVSYYYIRELRQLNGPLHLTDKQFRERIGSRCGSGCRASAG